jgi:hypothetical protein
MQVRFIYHLLGQLPVMYPVIQPPPEPRGPTLVGIHAFWEQPNPDGTAMLITFPFFFRGDFRDDGTATEYVAWARETMEKLALYDAMMT